MLSNLILKTNSKRLKVHFLLLLTSILIGNTFCISESSALVYSNPSTTPLWSYSTGNQYVSAVAISSDGSHVTATCQNNVAHISLPENGKLYLFDNSISKTKTPLWNYSIINSFYSVAISANGSNIVVGGGYSEATIYIFNNSNPTPQWIYYTGGWIYDVGITDDGSLAAAASGIRRKAFLLNNTESSSILEFPTTGLTLRVVLSSDGKYMAVTDNEGKLYFFDTSIITPEWDFTLSEYISTSLSISSDGNYIASGDDKVYIFRKNSSIPIWTYNTSDYVGSIKISKDGNYIAVGGGYTDYNVYLFNRSSPILKWNYTTKGQIASVAISYNGDYIVAQSYDNFLYLFNRNSSIPIWRYRLDGAFASSYDYSLDISTDGKYIVAGGRHYIYLFDRDIINAPQLIIPGYNLFFMSSLIGIMLVINVITTFRYIKKKMLRNHSY